MSIASFVRPLVAFTVVSLVAVPVALAQGHRGKDRGDLVEQGKRDERFPMSAKEFSEDVEKRIRKTFDRISAKLDEHKVPAAKREEIKKAMEAGATKIRAAAAKVGADGTVTKEEAKEVRDLAKDLKKQAHMKHGKAKGKGKGLPS